MIKSFRHATYLALFRTLWRGRCLHDLFFFFLKNIFLLQTANQTFKYIILKLLRQISHSSTFAQGLQLLGKGGILQLVRPQRLFITQEADDIANSLRGLIDASNDRTPQTEPAVRVVLIIKTVRDVSYICRDFLVLYYSSIGGTASANARKVAPEELATQHWQVIVTFVFQ